MMAFFPLAMALMVVTTFIAALTVGFVLPCLIKARGCFGMPEDDIKLVVDNMKIPEDGGDRAVWFMYIFVPMYFSILLPVFLPLSLRLMAGQGYVGALQQT